MPPKKATISNPELSQIKENLRTRSSRTSGDNANRKGENNYRTSKTKTKEKEELESQTVNGTFKRKAEHELNNEKNLKMSKNELSSDNDFSPRRSSRGVVPNRKFKDMEVNFTPGRKQSNATGKEVPKKKERPKPQSKVKRPTPSTNKNKGTKAMEESTIKSTLISPEIAATDKVSEESPLKSTAISQKKDLESANDRKIADDEVQDIQETKDTLHTDNDMETDCKSKDFPSIKIIRFDENEKMKITDFNQKEKNEDLIENLNNQSDTPDYSIIREEDLERITSELLELAQNAEQENNQLQQMFIKGGVDNNEQVCVAPGFTVTDIKIVEVHPESENNTLGGDGCEVLHTQSVQQPNYSGKDDDDNASTIGVKAHVDVEKFRSDLDIKKGVSSVQENSVEVDGQQTGPDVMVENIMQKKLSPEKSQFENIRSGETVIHMNNEDSIESMTSSEEFSKADVIPLSFMDSEIQEAVTSAIKELADKAEECQQTENVSEENGNIEKTESVSSSGTQTASEGNVIKLPALNPKHRIGPVVKSRIGPIVKSITVDVEQPPETESGEKSGNTSRQEFIIVHVPDGQTVKRTHVKVNKPEDLVPFSMDTDGQLHCGMCDYQTGKKVNMYKHRKKHVDDRSHCCPFCKYRTSTSSNLKRHIGIHQDIRNFQCDLCNTTFRQKIHLERHIRYRHEEKKVKCPLCDYVCANENPDLKVHMKRRHLPQDGEEGTYQAFKCEECGMMTVSKRDFKQHMKFHRTGPELKLFCDHCSFVTDCESRLKRHSYIHSKEKPFKCGMCEYRASQKEHVVRHMRSQHGIEIEKRSRKFDDDDSLSGSVDSKDESFETKSGSESTKQDRFDYSSQEKIFACNHCSMKFAKLLNLYKHLHAQHKEILPEQQDNEFLCVVCDFKTTTKKNLLVHMRKHNQIDQIPPSHVYSCVLCNYINPKRRNLFQHMKKKHGIEVVMKDDGSTSCFVTDGSVVAAKCDETVQNILTIGDIVTTETEEQELQIVTDDLEKDGMQVQNVISFDDLAYAVSHPQPHNRNLIVVEQNNAVVQHEAAEAIEGLQALAEQPGLVTSQEVIADVAPQIITDGEIENINTETETNIVSSETAEELNEAEEKIDSGGIQLSAEEVMHLSAGDFVEINGEMYKVEISEDTGISTESVITSS